MLSRIREDIAAALERDPAARTRLNVLLNYSGLHALWAHRWSHWLWRHRMQLLARMYSQQTRRLTGVEIHPAAVIGETAVVGDDVTMYHGVTLGGKSLEQVKRHPTVEDGVVIGAGAQVLGPITIGARSTIGANAVVVHDVPPDSIAVGVPARILPQRGSQP